MKTILAFFLLYFAISANAASFDCNKASNKIEKTICDNPQISKLDENLSALYKTQKNLNGMVVKTQRAWIKRRNTCNDSACVESMYKTRIAELSNSSSKKPSNEIVDKLNKPEKVKVLSLKDIPDGTYKYYGPGIADNNTSVETAKILCDNASKYTINSTHKGIMAMISGDMALRTIVSNGGSTNTERLYWVEKGKFSPTSFCSVVVRVSGLYNGTSYNNLIYGKPVVFEKKGSSVSVKSVQ